MAKYFGTDGFRGEANRTLTSMQAYRIGRFLGWYYTGRGKHQGKIVIGKDTRRSSYMFEYAIAAGIVASGADAYMLHVTTTPSISYVARQEGFDCGVMISASHNPYMDNGIKLVNRQGEKMEDEVILNIERYLDGNLADLGVLQDDLPLAQGEKIGRVVDHIVGRNRYIGWLIGQFAHSCQGMRIGLDCANGSTWSIAKNIFETFGAQTFVLGAEPDGLNINQNVGSTHIETLQSFVKAHRLDVGFAFDGDADRCLAVDHQGNLISGDHIMFILAQHLKEEGRLANNTLVTTVMSNLGLYRALEKAGIEYVQTDVGDKYVYECMRRQGHSLGGEQSGHIILGEYAATGDGLLTAIMLLSVMCEKKTTLQELAKPVVLLPQVTKNIRVADKPTVRANEVVRKKYRELQDRLQGEGRILMRESGTEEVIRVMVEAQSEQLCAAYADELLQTIRDLGFERT